MADKIGVTVKTIERDIAGMANIVGFVGSKRSGQWVVNNHTYPTNEI